MGALIDVRIHTDGVGIDGYENPTDGGIDRYPSLTWMVPLFRKCCNEMLFGPKF